MNFDVSFRNSCSVKMIKVAFQVSQGSVATQLGEVENMVSFYYKFLAEFNGERILKIGKHLVKL